uniref:YesL family protein n=1 Tax=Acetatifactor sp. TaxID=1872090 RepID=UPI004055B61E
MKLFDLDSPIMRILSRITDVLVLNILTFICCIPIVTAGASFTAMHYMALKLARNEETYLVKGFLKSFKQNFKQATIIWLIFLLAVAVLVGDFLIMRQLESAGFIKVIKIIVMVVAIIVLFTGTFVFPVLAKFDNPVSRTIKNAFVISVLQFPKTILMI